MDLQETDRFVKKVAIILFCYAYYYLQKNEEKIPKKSALKCQKSHFILTNVQYSKKTSITHHSEHLDQRMGDLWRFCPTKSFKILSLFGTNLRKESKNAKKHQFVIA
jgi:hypothetical protein